MNKCVLIGRLTKDPDLKFAANSGMAVVTFTLAVNRMKDKNGEVKADFIICKAFGKIAETIAQHVTKGNQFAVTGSIRTGSYDAQDGTKRYTTEVFVDGFDFISAGNSGERNNSSYNNGQKGDFGGASYSDDMEQVDDGFIPF